MIHVGLRASEGKRWALGHAVLTAREIDWRGSRLPRWLADDVIDAKVPVLKQLMNVFDEETLFP